MDYLNKKCIIRANRAGVFFGTVKAYDAQTRNIELADCRRLWYWDGAASISQLAMEGSKAKNNCKFTVAVPEIMITEVIEIIPCSEAAIKNIESVAEWRR